MPYLKPLPEVTTPNKPFWDGLKREEFWVPKCDDCGDYNWVPLPACRTCQSEAQRWTRVSGDATVWSYTIVHRGPGAFDDEVPYAIVLGKLVEEPRSLLVLANTEASFPLDQLKIGLPIHVVYEEVPNEDVTIYKFGLGA